VNHREFSALYTLHDRLPRHPQQAAQELLAIPVRRGRRVPNLFQIAPQRTNLFSLPIGKLQSLFLLFVRQLGFRDALLVEFVLPLGFQGASDQAVFRLHVSEPPLGSLGFVASSLDFADETV
jgi:hypothetical protein